MRPMITLFIVLNVLFVGLLAASPAPALVEQGTRAADFELADTEGVKHKFHDLAAGQVTLVVYWSVSCPHCRKDIPLLLEMAKDFQGNPFRMIAINADGPAMVPAARTYAREHKLPPPHLIDHGPGDAVPGAEAFDFIATPGIAVINPEGKIVLIQELEVDLGEIRKAVESAF